MKMLIGLLVMVMGMVWVGVNAHAASVSNPFGKGVVDAGIRQQYTKYSGMSGINNGSFSKQFIRANVNSETKSGQFNQVVSRDVSTTQQRLANAAALANNNIQLYTKQGHLALAAKERKNFEVTAQKLLSIDRQEAVKTNGAAGRTADYVDSKKAELKKK
jgi:hypothetical protein